MQIHSWKKAEKIMDTSEESQRLQEPSLHFHNCYFKDSEIAISHGSKQTAYPVPSTIL